MIYLDQEGFFEEKTDDAAAEFEAGDVIESTEASEEVTTEELGDEEYVMQDFPARDESAIDTFYPEDQNYPVLAPGDEEIPAAVETSGLLYLRPLEQFLSNVEEGFLGELGVSIGTGQDEVIGWLGEPMEWEEESAGIFPERWNYREYDVYFDETKTVRAVDYFGLEVSNLTINDIVRAYGTPDLIGSDMLTELEYAGYISGIHKRRLRALVSLLRR